MTKRLFVPHMLAALTLWWGSMLALAVPPDGSDAGSAPDTTGAAAAANPGSLPSYLDTGRPLTILGPYHEIPIHRALTAPQRATAALDLKPPAPTADFTDLTPASGINIGNVNKLLFSPDAPGIVVAVGASDENQTWLLVMDTNKPAASEVRAFVAKDQEVVAVAAGGRILVTRLTTWQAVSLHIWVYNNQKYELRANYGFIEDRRNKIPESAIMLSATRMVMRSGSDNYLIDLPTNSQVAAIECNDITLHSSGKFLLATKKRDAIVMRTSDLAVIEDIPNAAGHFTLDPSGTLLAVAGDAGIDLLKASNKEPAAHLPGVVDFTQLAILGPTDLLVNGSDYYDAKTGIPVWNYQLGQGASMQLADGQMLYVANASDGQMLACAATVPDADALEGLRHASAARFAIRPGAHIAIAGDLGAFGDAAKAHKYLESAIAAAGQVYDPDSKAYTLTIKAGPGDTGTFSLEINREFDPPAVKDISAPSSVVEATLTAGDAVIWTAKRKYQAQGFVAVRRGQSPEDAVAEAAHLTPESIRDIRVPGYVLKGQPGGVQTLGSSVLTRGGFTIAPPPPKP
jgi:hypothetical protein